MPARIVIARVAGDMAGATPTQLESVLASPHMMCFAGGDPAY